MISDVLFDAIIEIQGYQERMPDIYNPYEKRINDVVHQMNALRAELDKLPTLKEPL